MAGAVATESRCWIERQLNPLQQPLFLIVQSTTALSPYRIPVIVMEATVSAVVSA